MPPILFPSSTSPGKDYIESAGRLVNAYAEKLQSGGPAQQIIRRTPGLTLFGDSEQSGIRGLWYDGSTAVYAAYTSALSWFNFEGTDTLIGSIPDGAVGYSGKFSSTTDASGYTLTSVPFGEADADRRMVVGVAAQEYAGSEVVANGTFTSTLGSWTASGGWVWQTAANPFAGVPTPAAANVIVNGTFNSSLSSWTVINDGVPSPSDAWSWSSTGGNGFALCQITSGGLSGFMGQSFATVSGTTYRITVSPKIIFPAPGSAGTIRVYLDGLLIRIFTAESGSQSINFSGTGGSRQLSFRAVVTTGARIGIDNVTVVPVAFPVPTLTQSVATAAGTSYKLKVTPRKLTAGAAGTITVSFGGVAVGTFSAAAAAQTFIVAGNGASQQLKITANPTVGTIGVDDVSVKYIHFALPTAVTIGGVAATSVVSLAGHVALWIANVPTTTSGSIVLTYANTMNEASVMVWRMIAASSTPTDTAAIAGNATVDVEVGSVSVFMSQHSSGTLTGSGVTLSATDHPSTYIYSSGFSGRSNKDSTASVTGSVTRYTVGASWAGTVTTLGNGAATFAKNNKVPTPDQLMCTSGVNLVPFTKAGITAAISVNSEIPTSVCFGEGYFFVTTTLGRCYASGINVTTFNSLDSIRAEQRPESLTRGVFVGGELFLFGPTHVEVWASRGNPNATGFPLNYVTSIPRGIIATLAVTGFEEGFEGGMFWVADDHSVRMLQGYQPKTISPPALERAISACGNKTRIRMMCYDVDGHACVVVDLAGEATWVYDITEGGLWHERDTADSGYWRATGNSVHAFDVWIVGDRLSGNLYQIDDTARNDGGEAMPFIVESIAMEAFPTRLKVSRAEFNWISGVGNAAAPNPEVEISWSDTGGHRWVDPLTRKLGEGGRYYEQVRINGLGMTGVKGRRFRLRVDDEVEVGLLAGSMDVASL